MAKLGSWLEMKLTAARDKCREEKGVEASLGTFQDLISSYVKKLETEEAASAGEVKWSLKHYVSDSFLDLVSKPASLIGPVQSRNIIVKMIDAG
jgi:hypothetical protein